MIGVFDSGFGGLTVLKELLKVLPEYDYIYLGDQARVPYGARSKETIQKFSKAGIDFLLQKGAKVILIACNTATAAALHDLQKAYPNEPILGIIVPAAEAALKVSRYGNIGVVGTRATVISRAYVFEMQKREDLLYNPEEKKACGKVSVWQKATPLLVPLIEENWLKKPETRMVLRKYLRELKDFHVDTLILGCTHYSLLEKLFARVMGRNCKIINSSLEQARSFVQYLENHGDLEAKLGKKSVRGFYTTDCPKRFEEMGSIFLGESLSAEKVFL